MAVIKKAIIKNSELPYITFDTDETGYITELYYALRYRIISDDKNRTSHWSPINKIIMPPTGTDNAFPLSDISFHKGNGDAYITAIWSFPLVLTDFQQIFSNINTWDVWVRWGHKTGNTNTWLTDWQYSTTVTGTSFSSLVPTGLADTANYVAIALQVPTLNKVRDFDNNKLTIFYTEGVI